MTTLLHPLYSNSYLTRPARVLNYRRVFTRSTDRQHVKCQLMLADKVVAEGTAESRKWALELDADVLDVMWEEETRE